MKEESQFDYRETQIHYSGNPAPCWHTACSRPPPFCAATGSSSVKLGDGRGIDGVREEDQRPPPSLPHSLPPLPAPISRRPAPFSGAGDCTCRKWWASFPFEPAALAQGWQPISALHRLLALPWTRILNTARRELDGPTYASRTCIPTQLLIFIGQINLSGPFNSVTFCRQGGLLNRFHRLIRE